MKFSYPFPPPHFPVKLPFRCSRFLCLHLNNHYELNLQFLHCLHWKATKVKLLKVFRCVKTFLLFHRQQQTKSRSWLTHSYIFVTSIHPKCYCAGLVVLRDKSLWKWPWRRQRTSFMVLVLLHALKTTKLKSLSFSFTFGDKYFQKSFNFKMSPLMKTLNLTAHCKALCTAASMYTWSFPSAF